MDCPRAFVSKFCHRLYFTNGSAWEPSGLLPCQETSLLVFDPKIDYRAWNTRSLDLIPHCSSQFRIHTPYVFLRSCFISFFCLILGLKRGPLPSGLHAPVHLCYFFLPSHCTWFYYYHNNVQRVTKVMNAIIVQIFEIPFPLPHQTLLLNTLVLCFPLDMRGQIFIQTQNSRQDYSFICFNI